MTRPRYDEHSTEFGLWLRKQKEIDSKSGFVATNVDFVWRNYKTGRWMIIEEKRYMCDLTFAQEEIYKTLTKCCKNDPNFQGFYLLQFERTSPEDGEIVLNGKQITNDELIKFLQFAGKGDT